MRRDAYALDIVVMVLTIGNVHLDTDSKERGNTCYGHGRERKFKGLMSRFVAVTTTELLVDEG